MVKDEITQPAANDITSSDSIFLQLKNNMMILTNSFLSLGIFIFVVAAVTATDSCSCELIPGAPGKDGRDGIQGPPGTISFSEYITLKQEILREIRQELCRNELSCTVVESNTTTDATPAPPTSPPPPPLCGTSAEKPCSSCDDIYEIDSSAASDYYWVNTTTDGVKEVYCGINLPNCDAGDGAWTRVAYFDMSDPQTLCPDKFTERQAGSHRVCVKSAFDCDSYSYSTFNKPYTHVCGRAVGYQYGFRGPCAFHASQHQRNIDSRYLSGISFTHGASGSRTHIWSLAVGWADTYTNGCNCPCAFRPGDYPNSFVGNNYFCESATPFPPQNQWYVNQTLWDGEDCYTGSNCCSRPSAPWFLRQLPSETTDDLEIRWCGSGGQNADSPLGTTMVEVFVK